MLLIWSLVHVPKSRRLSDTESLRYQTCGRGAAEDYRLKIPNETKAGWGNMRPVKFFGVCALGFALALPAYADRGSGAYRKGQRAERQANLDAAYGFYNQAHTLSPKNPKYFMAYTQTRFKAATEHVHNGELLRNSGA